MGRSYRLSFIAEVDLFQQAAKPFMNGAGSKNRRPVNPMPETNGWKRFFICWP